MPAKREDITDEGVRKLASYGCTQSEIADFFDCSPSTIAHAFAKAWLLGRSDLQTSLRRWQLRNARKGSDKMLIHLGQQYLGQSEKIERVNREGPKVLKVPAKEIHDDSGSADDQPAAGTADEASGEHG